MGGGGYYKEALRWQELRSMDMKLRRMAVRWYEHSWKEQIFWRDYKLKSDGGATGLSEQIESETRDEEEQMKDTIRKNQSGQGT